MRVVQINSFGNLSTGSIMHELDREYRSQGAETWMFWGRGCPTENGRAVNFNTRLNTYLDGLATRIDGKAGFHSKKVTGALMEKLDAIDPDLLHLHNLHGYYLNIEMVFRWIEKHHCKVRWTLHDCWAFTGHCVYFTYANCAQWKHGCAQKEYCRQLNTYPKTFCKPSCHSNYIDKKRIFTNVPFDRMEIVTPSYWLAGLVKQSFLKDYSVTVRHNKIDTEIFKPTPSDFRDQHGIGSRVMILGVASTWSERKGLADFVRLANELDSQRYVIVLVGLTGRQIKQLPKEILALGRTSSAQELASIYTAADVFFNPTREENYPTVNLESQACGTPIVTYNTGGCGETLMEEVHGSCVVSNFYDAVNMLERIVPKAAYSDAEIKHDLDVLAGQISSGVNC